MQNILHMGRVEIVPPRAVGGAVTITGLTGGVAEIGTHAGIALLVSQGTVTALRWGSAPGGSQYGTGTSPTDIAAGDGGTLYATATVDGSDHFASAAIRHAAPVTAGGVPDQTYTVGGTISVLDVAADFTVSGDAGLSDVTFALAASSAALPAGLSLSAAGVITGTPTVEADAVTIVVRGTNSGGYGDTAFDITVSAASAAATVVGVTVGAYGSGAAPITIDATGAQIGDTVYTVLFPATEAAPSATEVVAGQKSGGTAATDAGSDTIMAIPHNFSDAIADGIARAGYRVAAVIDNGALSNAEVSAPFTLSTTPAVLSGQSFTATAAEGVDWAFTADVVSDAVTGYRVSLWADGTDPSDALIASGSGSVATVTGTAAATVAETGSFASLGAGTYQPTIYYIDDFGNETFETLSDVTIAAAGPLWSDDFSGYTAGQDLTSENANYTILNGASPVVISGEAVRGDGTFDGVYVNSITEADDQVGYILATLGGSGKQARIYVRFVDASNNYFVRVTDAGAWAIRRRLSGSETGLTSGSGLTIGTDDKIELRAVGTSLAFYFNDVLIGSTTDTNHTSGKVGFVLQETTETATLFVVDDL